MRLVFHCRYKYKSIHHPEVFYFTIEYLVSEFLPSLEKEETKDEESIMGEIIKCFGCKTGRQFSVQTETQTYIGVKVCTCAYPHAVVMHIHTLL